MKEVKEYSLIFKIISFALCSILFCHIVPATILTNVIYEYNTKQSVAYDENKTFNSIETEIIDYNNGFYEEYQYNDIEKVEKIWYNYSNGSRINAYSYDYNEDGNLEKFTNSVNGEIIEYAYNDAGRLTSSSERNISNYYYKNDYLVDYDDLERVVEETNTIDYLASSSNCNTSVRATYDYNSDGSLQQEQIYYGENKSIISEYTYDDYVRPTQSYMTSGNFSHTTGYAYCPEGEDAEGLLKTYTSNVNGVVTTYTYNYDSNVNLTCIVDKNGNTIEYAYDSLGQLVTETKGNITWTYTYDDRGNITSITKSTIAVPDPDPGFSPIIHWSLNRPTILTAKALEYTNSQDDNLLVSFNGQDITYDEIGNPLSYYNGTSYSFTWEGRKLVGAVSGSKTMSFEYNDEGMRTKKTVNGVDTVYYLNYDKIIAEKTDGKTVIYIYDVTNTPIGMKYRENSYAEGVFDVFWFEKNIQGDVIAIYDESGNKLVTYNYNDSWGNHTVSYSNGGASTGAAYNRFRYRSYYYDLDLGMYYLQSRYYDANICRFISPKSSSDSDEATLENNTYAYCLNSPVIHICEFGVAFLPFGELSWPGEIHREIQEYLKDNYGYVLETLVNDGKGRIDLVKEQNAYEIKPFTTPKIIAQIQLQNYIDLSDGYYVAGVAAPELTGNFNSNKGYRVRYYYMGDGIIQYAFYRELDSELSFSPYLSTQGNKDSMSAKICLVGIAAIVLFVDWETIFNKSGLKVRI